MYEANAMEVRKCKAVELQKLVDGNGARRIAEELLYVE